MAKTILRPGDFNKDRYKANRKDCWSGSFFPAYMAYFEAQLEASKDPVTGNVDRDPITGKKKIDPTKLGNVVALEALYKILGKSSEEQFKGFLRTAKEEETNHEFWAKWGYARGAQKKFGLALRYIENDLLINKLTNPKMGFLKYYLNPEENPITRRAGAAIMDGWYGFLSHTPLINTIQEKLDEQMDSLRMQYYAAEIEKAANAYLLLSVNLKPELVEGLPEVFRNANRQPGEPVLPDAFINALQAGGLKDAIKELPGYKDKTINEILESCTKNTTDLLKHNGDYQTDRTAFQKIDAAGHAIKDFAYEARKASRYRVFNTLLRRSDIELHGKDSMGYISGTEKCFANLSNAMYDTIQWRLEKIEEQRAAHASTADNIRNLRNNQELAAALSQGVSFAQLAAGFAAQLEFPIDPVTGRPKVAGNMTGEEFENYSKTLEEAIAEASNPQLSFAQLRAGAVPSPAGELYKAKMRLSYENITKFKKEIAVLSQSMSLTAGAAPVAIDFNDITPEDIEAWAEAGHLTGNAYLQFKREYTNFKRTLDEISEITQVGKPTHGNSGVELEQVNSHYTRNLDAVTEYKAILEGEFAQGQVQTPPPSGFNAVRNDIRTKVAAKIADPAMIDRIEKITGKPISQTPNEMFQFIQTLTGLEVYAKFGDPAERQRDPQGDVKYQAYLKYNEELRTQMDIMVEKGTFVNAAESNKIAWEIIKDIEPDRAASAEKGGPLGEIYGRQIGEEIRELEANAKKVSAARTGLESIAKNGGLWTQKNKFTPKDGPNARMAKSNNSCVEFLDCHPELKKDVEKMELSDQEVKLITKDCKKKGLDIEEALLARKVRKFAVLPEDVKEETFGKMTTQMSGYAAQNFAVYGSAAVTQASGLSHQQGSSQSSISNQQNIGPNPNQSTVQEEVETNNSKRPKTETKEEFDARKKAENAVKKETEEAVIVTKAEVDKEVAEEEPKEQAEQNAAIPKDPVKTILSDADKEMGMGL